MYLELIIASLLILWFLAIFVADFINTKKRDAEDGDLRKVLVYHCVKCGHIYGLPSEKDTEGCPKCGRRNVSLKF